MEDTHQIEPIAFPRDQPKRRRRRSRDQWASLIAQQSQTSLSVAEFCAQQGINVASFYAWKKRLIQTPCADEAPRFVQLEAVADDRQMLTACLPGGIRIELNTSVLPAFIAACRQADAC